MKDDAYITFTQWLDLPAVKKTLDEQLNPVKSIEEIYYASPLTYAERMPVLLIPTMLYVAKQKGLHGLKVTGRSNREGDSFRIKLFISEEINFTFTVDLDTPLEGDRSVPLVLITKAKEMGPNAMTFITPFFNKAGEWIAK